MDQDEHSSAILNALVSNLVTNMQMKELAEEDVQEILDFSKIEYDKVNVFGINPKSITLEMLYGFNDETSNEWNDGVIAKVFRECVEDKSQSLNWVLFDGPVDAVWIENMNTVLDDNKKLCLGNQETIKLTDQMRIMFEVEDLLEVSALLIILIT